MQRTILHSHHHRQSPHGHPKGLLLLLFFNPSLKMTSRALEEFQALSSFPPGLLLVMALLREDDHV